MRVLGGRGWERWHEERLRHGCRKESWMAAGFVTSTPSRSVLEDVNVLLQLPFRRAPAIACLPRAATLGVVLRPGQLLRRWLTSGMILH